MEWLTNCIGEEYKRWTNRDKVFIASPTGSGKTYFKTVFAISLPKK